MNLVIIFLLLFALSVSRSYHQFKKKLYPSLIFNRFGQMMAQMKIVTTEIFWIRFINFVLVFLYFRIFRLDSTLSLRVILLTFPMDFIRYGSNERKCNDLKRLWMIFKFLPDFLIFSTYHWRAIPSAKYLFTSSILIWFWQKINLGPRHRPLAPLRRMAHYTCCSGWDI